MNLLSRLYFWKYMHIFKLKDTNFFQPGSLLPCVQLNVLSCLVCRKAILKVVSFERLRKSLLCSLVLLSIKGYSNKTPCKIRGVGIEGGSHPQRKHKYIDVLNMRRNQPTAIFPSELDDLVCTNEPPAETHFICRQLASRTK